MLFAVSSPVLSKPKTIAPHITLEFTQGMGHGDGDGDGGWRVPEWGKTATINRTAPAESR